MHIAQCWMKTRFRSNQKSNKAQQAGASPVCEQIHDEPVFGVDVGHQAEDVQQIHQVLLINTNTHKQKQHNDINKHRFNES